MKSIFQFQVPALFLQIMLLPGFMFLQGFISSKYYAWLVTGSVTIHITRTGGANAVLSGILFN